jgi:hypothetical protein
MIARVVPIITSEMICPGIAALRGGLYVIRIVWSDMMNFVEYALFFHPFTLEIIPSLCYGGVELLI